MKTSIIGYPRIGAQRELKAWTEQYFRGELSEERLCAEAKHLRARQWQTQAGLDLIPVNDFSFYDTVLDTAALFGVIPERYRALGLSSLGTYFAMARGYQGPEGDVKALSMRKWFNTNYHYIVPELDDSVTVQLDPEGKLFSETAEAVALGRSAKPVLIGPFTFLKLLRYTGTRHAEEITAELTAAYGEVFQRLGTQAISWLQLDEPILVADLTAADLALFQRIYEPLLAQKANIKVLLQTYFGDVRDAYETIQRLPFDGVGLDFVEGEQSLSLVQRFGFPRGQVLFAGLVNGKNIWKNDYTKTLKTLETLQTIAPEIVLSSSCSLLHVPYTVTAETALAPEITAAFAFAEEKLIELAELAALADTKKPQDPAWLRNQEAQNNRRNLTDPEVQARVQAIKKSDYTRLPALAERKTIQENALGLPLLPTTTIGSFPQTAEVKANRAAFRRGERTPEAHQKQVEDFTERWIRLQEELGIDVLVHGEFERNDMVEFFGEHLTGFVFTKFAWVQSYGTRCVKPPIIFRDVKREKAFTVDLIQYAQSLTDKPVKGMLTGAITILNWSFPREDLSPAESVTQIALAIRDEVLDLEAAGIRIIQVDEAALREKLPLRRADWHRNYLDWAIPAFRLIHSGVKPETQIHTHMCYSEFQDIIPEIDAMDADVISFEAARSDLTLVKTLKAKKFQTAVGPGVYDIHSPRVPSVEELTAALETILAELPKEQLWVNPDCGLKTRGEPETLESLRNLVTAAKAVREAIQ